MAALRRTEPVPLRLLLPASPPVVPVVPWLLGTPMGRGRLTSAVILMRVADDPDRRVLVFDRNEWECFLDGARKGEFDDAAGNATS